MEVIGPVTQSQPLRGKWPRRAMNTQTGNKNMGFILPTRFSGYSWTSSHSNLQVLGPAPSAGAESRVPGGWAEQGPWFQEQWGNHLWVDGKKKKKKESEKQRLWGTAWMRAGFQGRNYGLVWGGMGSSKPSRFGYKLRKTYHVMSQNTVSAWLKVCAFFHIANTEWYEEEKHNRMTINISFIHNLFKWILNVE